MKVGIMTFHRASNYGAVLQAYALQKKIVKLGYECEIIDYRSEYLEQYYKPFSIPSRTIKKTISSIVNAPIKFIRNRAFERFRNRFLSLSRMYTSLNIKEAIGQYDLIVFGSDQVWNIKINGNDSNFCGAFCEETEKLVSYAASIGNPTIEMKTSIEYKKLLGRFKYLSSREKSGVEFIREYIQREAVQVLDPVFLLDKNEWEKLTEYKAENNDYILLYHLKGEKTKINEYAQVLAREKNLKIIDVQGWAKKYPPNTRPRFSLNPDEFINLIKNANYVITDSFHCASFAIIFEKNFWVNVDKRDDFENTRIGNLLTKIGLESRLVPEDYIEWKYNVNPDYLAANKRLAKYVSESSEYLKLILDGEKYVYKL